MATIRQYFEEDQEERSLTDPHRWILRELQRSPGATVGQLAARLDLPTAVCARLIDALDSRSRLLRRHQIEPAESGQMPLGAARSRAFLRG